MEVAEELGLSRQAISRWESGLAFPSTENLKKLSVLYGVSVDELLHGSSEETVQESVTTEVPFIPAEHKKQKKLSASLVIGIILVITLVVVFTMWYTHWEPGVLTFDRMESSNWDNSDATEFDFTW